MSRRRPAVYRKPESLIAALGARGHGGVIYVDGFDGTGKSTLAARLCAAIDGAVHIELDEYLNRNQDGYVDHLRYDELAARLAAVRQAGGTAVLDGVCMRVVLERLGITNAVGVYVKLLIERGYWLDGQFLRMNYTAEEAVAHEQRLADTMAVLENGLAVPLPNFRKELIRYHAHYRPHEAAEFVFERLEQPQSLRHE